MKIIANKSGRWAQDEPWKKQIVMTEGKTYAESAIPLAMMDMLVDKKFAEFLSDDEKVVFIETSDVAEKAISAIEEIDSIVSSSKNTKDAKNKLEAWGKANLGIDIDRRKGVKTIAKKLVEASADGKR